MNSRKLDQIGVTYLMQVNWNGFRPSGLLCDTGARTRKRICFVRTRPADARRVHAVYDPPDSVTAFKDPYVAWMRCRGCDLVVYLGLENPNVYLRRSKRPLMLLLGEGRGTRVNGLSQGLRRNNRTHLRAL